MLSPSSNIGLNTQKSNESRSINEEQQLTAQGWNFLNINLQFFLLQLNHIQLTKSS